MPPFNRPWFSFYHSSLLFYCGAGLRCLRSPSSLLHRRGTLPDTRESLSAYMGSGSRTRGRLSWTRGRLSRIRGNDSRIRGSCFPYTWERFPDTRRLSWTCGRLSRIRGSDSRIRGNDSRLSMNRRIRPAVIPDGSIFLFFLSFLFNDYERRSYGRRGLCGQTRPDR
jgi:hypothetical protein